jgi:hypothetical protein
MTSKSRLNAEFPETLKFFHKTGSTSDSASDAGYFRYDDEIDIVLVGLQGFSDFAPLRKVGGQTLKLIYSP